MSEPTKEQILNTAVYNYHYEAAHRPCVSSNTFAACFISNGHQFIPAVTAALSSIGGPHGPIKQCYALLSDMYQELNIKFDLDKGEKVPGFGSSFTDVEDELLGPIDQIIEDRFGGYYKTIEECRARVCEFTGKSLFPNGAFYTALTARLVGMDAITSERIFVIPRINAWADMTMQIIEKSA